MPPIAIVVVLASTFLHAGWNLLVKPRARSRWIFLELLLVISVPGTVVVLLLERGAAPLLPHILPFVIGAGAAQAVYFLGLTAGYRVGDFSLVYPLARALPVLLVSGFDLARGRLPTLPGWLGLILVLAGCVVVAVPARPRFAAFPRAAVGWAALAALGTVGYSVFDALAAEAIAVSVGADLGHAFRYELWEFATTTVLFAPLLMVFNRFAGRGADARVAEPAPRPRPRPRARPGRRLPALVGISLLIYATYGLVLWAYQLSWQTSYVVALRQFSIVLGVAAGAVIFKEAAQRARLTGAVVIAVGVATLAIA